MNGYKLVWKSWVKPHIGDMALRDVQAVTVTDLLANLKADGIGHSTLKHVKAVGSAIFSRALAYSILTTPNPFGLAKLPKRQGKRPTNPAVSYADVWTILRVLETAQKESSGKRARALLQARAAIGLTYFGGLVASEARGAMWDDYEGSTLQIRQSVWRQHIGPTKVESREAPIPVGEPLRGILTELRIADGNPTMGFILRGRKGQPLNLDILRNRVIRPVLEGAGIGWKDAFRSNRRGASTDLTTVARDNGMAAKGLLRHSQLSTTNAHYIKSVPAETSSAVAALEQRFADYGASMEQAEATGKPN